MKGLVLAIAKQKDGKIIIGGDFTVVQGQSRRGICRLLSSGSIDLSFNPMKGFDGVVYGLIVQPDGRILVCGDFTQYNHFSCNGVIRLKGDASVDGSFKSSLGGATGGTVFCMALQEDGKVYIGGNFTSYNSTPRNRLARLLSDGELDTSFNPGAGANSTVRCMAVGSGATPQLFIGGTFTNYAGSARGRVAAVNQDGSVATASFSLGGANGDVNSLWLDETNSKLYVAGNFLAFNGISKKRLTRVATTGNVVDADYGSNDANAFDNVINTIALTKAGRLFVGGGFTKHVTNSAAPTLATATRVALLDDKGFLDQSFTAGSATAPLAVSGPDDVVRVINTQSDGKVLLGGDFSQFNGLAQKGITRLSSKGASDGTFYRAKGVGGEVYSIARQSDGKLILGGVNLFIYGSQQTRSLLRLNKDGSLDQNFNVELGVGEYLNKVLVQADGKILIGGDFSEVNGQSQSNLARLNVNGTLDTSFNSSLALNEEVYSIAIRPNGKILIGGEFTSPKNRIVQLNTDGTVDSSFDVGTGCNNTVLVIKLSPEGKTYIGGNFTTVNGVARERIARLDAAGSVDTTFVTSSGASGSVWAIALNPFGTSIFIGGGFTQYAGTARGRIAAVTATGGLDTSFAPPGTGFNSGVVYDIITNPDTGGFIIGGSFSQYNGITTGSLCHVYSYGPGLQTYSNNDGMTGIVYDLEPSPDGAFYAGGEIEDYADTPVSVVAKLRSIVRPQAQTFTGLVQSSTLVSAANELHLLGKMTLALSATGACTGSISTLKERISVLGNVGSNGQFAAQATTKSGANIPIFMNMLQHPTDREGIYISGSMIDTLGSRVSFQLYPAFYSKSRPASSLAGKHHLIITQPVEDVTGSLFEPFSGNGYLTWTVSSTGSSTLIGKAVDGSVITGAGALNYLNTTYDFVPLYQKTGFMTLQLTAVHGGPFASSDVQASLVGQWFRLPDSSYPSGFALNVGASGYEYVPKRANLSPFGTLAAPSSARLALYGGHAPGIGSPLIADLKFALSGIGTVTGVDQLPGLKISVNRAKGTFSGSFLPTGPGFPAGGTKRANFQGILGYVNNQDGNASGYSIIDIGGVKKTSFVNLYTLAAEP